MARLLTTAGYFTVTAETRYQPLLCFPSLAKLILAAPDLSTIAASRAYFPFGSVPGIGIG